jgi:EF-P beta-lysylation protein EpmB
VLPRTQERGEQQEFSMDPLGELALTRDGVIQKYSARALVVTTAACPVHCRYCFRRHFPYESQAASRGNWSAALTELQSLNGIREVILSGGDPLTLSNRRLRELVSELESFATLTTIRIHSRFPIILPQRIDDELLEILRETRLKTVLVVHCNHANEIDESVKNALNRVRGAGTVVLNQSVLLRGVNDNVDSLEALSYRLFEAGTLPYYLHQLDSVAGAAHFEVEDRRALKLIGALRQRLPGYLVPGLVRELPGELSKTPIVKSHL